MRYLSKLKYYPDRIKNTFESIVNINISNIQKKVFRFICYTLAIHSLSACSIIPNDNFKQTIGENTKINHSRIGNLLEYISLDIALDKKCSNLIEDDKNNDPGGSVIECNRLDSLIKRFYLDGSYEISEKIGFIVSFTTFLVASGCGVDSINIALDEIKSSNLTDDDRLVCFFIRSSEIEDMFGWQFKEFLKNYNDNLPLAANSVIDKAKTQSVFNEDFQNKLYDYLYNLHSKEGLVGVYEIIDDIRDVNPSFPNVYFLNVLSKIQENHIDIYGDPKIESHENQNQNILKLDSYWDFHNLKRLINLSLKINNIDEGVDAAGFSASGSFGPIYLGILFKKDFEFFESNGHLSKDFPIDIGFGSSAGALFPVWYYLYREASRLNPALVPFSLSTMILYLPKGLEGKTMKANGDEIIKGFKQSSQDLIEIINKQKQGSKLPNIDDLTFDDLDLNFGVVASRRKDGGDYQQVIFSGSDNVTNAILASSNPRVNILWNFGFNLLADVNFANNDWNDGFHTNVNPFELNLFYNPRELLLAVGWPNALDIEDIGYRSVFSETIETLNFIPEENELDHMDQGKDWDVATAIFRIYLGYYGEIDIVNLNQIIFNINSHEHINEQDKKKLSKTMVEYFISKFRSSYELNRKLVNRNEDGNDSASQSMTVRIASISLSPDGTQYGTQLTHLMPVELYEASLAKVKAIEVLLANSKISNSDKDVIIEGTLGECFEGFFTNNLKLLSDFFYIIDSLNIDQDKKEYFYKKFSSKILNDNGNLYYLDLLNKENKNYGLDEFLANPFIDEKVKSFIKEKLT